MADFSGQGPTPDGRVKPDVVAPGVNVLSSIPESSCGGVPCWAFFDGTSMATPHLAGSAAILRWLYPSWSAAQVRSAIINTADRNVLKKFNSTELEQDVNIIGTGRENLLSAVNAVVTLDPVSVSFGAVPSGSGKSRRLTVTLNNVSAGPATCAVVVGPADESVSYFVSPASLSLNTGQSTNLTILMMPVKGARAGGHQATLTLTVSGQEVAHAAVYTLIQ